MKNVLLFAASYPYTAGIITVIWFGSAVLLRVDDTLDLGLVLVINSFSTLFIALIGFRR